MVPSPPSSQLKRFNDEAIARAEALRAGRVEGLPRKLTLELSADCNAWCPHCEFTPLRVWRRRHAPERVLHIPWEDVERFGERAFPHIRLVTPSVVGEPLMYPWWERFVDLVAKHDVRLEIFTNGALFTRESLGRTLPVTEALFFSMDGGSTRTFNRYRAGTDFEHVCSRVRLAAELRGEAGPEIWIATTLMRGWAHELPDLARRARDMGADGLAALHLIAFSERWDQESLLCDPSLANPILEETARVARELDLMLILPVATDSGRSFVDPASQEALPRRRTADMPDHEDGQLWCKFLWREAFIAFDGHLSPCCVRGRPVAGNLAAPGADLGELWNGPVLSAMRTGLADPARRHGACATCPVLAHQGRIDYDERGYTKDYGILPRRGGSRPS